MRLLFTILFLLINVGAAANPITITCSFRDSNGDVAKLQFTLDPEEGLLANSAVSMEPTIPALDISDDLWFWQITAGDRSAYRSDFIAISRNGRFWLASFLDLPGANNDGPKMIGGTCPAIPR